MLHDSKKSEFYVQFWLIVNLTRVSNSIEVLSGWKLWLLVSLYSHNCRESYYTIPTIIITIADTHFYYSTQFYIVLLGCCIATFIFFIVLITKSHLFFILLNFGFLIVGSRWPSFHWYPPY